MKKKNQMLQDKRVTAVCSPMSSSGVTLTAMALACVLAEEGGVSYAELGQPYVFEAFGLAKRFLLSGFTDCFDAYEQGKSLRSGENLWHGVHWALRPGALLPGQKPLSSPEEILRFAEKLPGAHTVLDCSGLDSALLEGVLARADRILLVVDPLPGKLIPAAPRLQRLRYAFPGARLVLCRMNPGVHRKTLNDYLGTEDYLQIPDVGAAVIYKAQFSCVLPWDLPEGRKLLASLKKQE